MVRVSGLLGVSLELAPRVMDAVALRDSVVLVERVDDGVRDGVLVEVPVPVPVAVCDGVGSGVGLAVRVNEDVIEGVHWCRSRGTCRRTRQSIESRRYL